MYLQTPCNCLPPLSKQQIDENHRIEALKDLTRPLELVIKQEKNSEDRLSPYSNFYYQHLIIQQIFQPQCKSQPSQT